MTRLILMRGVGLGEETAARCSPAAATRGGPEGIASAGIQRRSKSGRAGELVSGYFTSASSARISAINRTRRPRAKSVGAMTLGGATPFVA
jgi:hypothetical protein